jgi:predicted ATPase/class 3 adenylate cyclase
VNTTGFLALLIVDLVNSTELAQGLGDHAATQLWAAHDRMARDLLATWRGREIDKSDGFLLVFDDVGDAVAYALNYHRALARLPVPLRARAGIHAGRVILRENSSEDVARGAKQIEVEGLAKPITARLAALAVSGQTLLSAEACAAWTKPVAHVRSHGHWRLKGVAEPAELFEVGDDSCPFTPPSDVEKAYRVVQRGGVWVPVREVANNLPHPMTSFIGRGHELGEIVRRFERTRLLTLVGAGGLGKTRLALQTARSLMGDFTDGAWFVDLASVSDPRDVPQAVSSALRVREESGRALMDALLQHLESHALLIVLDNCEHVLEAGAQLARRALERAAHVRILATSREPLRITGEACYVLPPMDLPPEHGQDSDTELRRCEAVQLFVERAQAVQPAFAIDAANSASVVEICRRLDAIPLAIELAAARLRALSVDQIVQRLNDRFRLLVSGDRTVLPRQQTLRALIDWSHDLLSTNERMLLRRLAVFAGGWSLDAAESIGCDGSMMRADVVDLLAQLVERSLVSMESSGERYRLLESVRAYALERLEEAGEGDATRTRHLDYYLDLAQRAAPALWGEQQGQWVAQLNQERENLLVAHRWCDRAPEGAHKGLALVTSLQLYWMPGGLLELGYRVTDEALQRHSEGPVDEGRCRALYAASQLAYFMGKLNEAFAHGAASLALARATGLTCRAIDALLMMAYIGDDRGCTDESLSHYQEAIDLARGTDDRARLSYALNGLGSSRMYTDPDAAIPLLEESVQLAHEVGDEDSAAVTLQNLARCLVIRGRLDEAAARLRESLQVGRRIGSARVVILCIDVCAMVAAAGGQSAEAALFLGAADAQWQRIGVTRAPTEEVHAGQASDQARARLGSAFVAHHTEGHALGLDEAATAADVWLRTCL